MTDRRDPSLKDLRKLVMEYGTTLWLSVPLNVVVPVLLVVTFWGTWVPGKLILFSGTVLVVAIYFAWHGWEPWNMPIQQAQRGSRLEPRDYNTLQRETVALFRSNRGRRIQFTWIASGAVVPWFISGISSALGLTPLRVPTPAWIGVILGVADSLRGRSIALRFLAREWLNHFPLDADTA